MYESFKEHGGRKGQESNVTNEIKRMGDPKDKISKELQSGHASNTQTRSFGQLDQFVSVELAKQQMGLGTRRRSERWW